MRRATVELLAKLSDEDLFNVLHAALLARAPRLGVCAAQTVFCVTLAVMEEMLRAMNAAAGGEHDA